jgi:hypothetical protein
MKKMAIALLMMFSTQLYAQVQVELIDDNIHFYYDIALDTSQTKTKRQYIIDAINNVEKKWGTRFESGEKILIYFHYNIHPKDSNKGFNVIIKDTPKKTKLQLKKHHFVFVEEKKDRGHVYHRALKTITLNSEEATYASNWFQIFMFQAGLIPRSNPACKADSNLLNGVCAGMDGASTEVLISLKYLWYELQKDYGTKVEKGMINFNVEQISKHKNYQKDLDRYSQCQKLSSSKCHYLNPANPALIMLDKLNNDVF